MVKKAPTTTARKLMTTAEKGGKDRYRGSQEKKRNIYLDLGSELCTLT
jgi:hypothetical protein